jgi:hypothetical protein
VAAAWGGQGDGGGGVGRLTEEGRRGDGGGSAALAEALGVTSSRGDDVGDGGATREFGSLMMLWRTLAF